MERRAVKALVFPTYAEAAAADAKAMAMLKARDGVRGGGWCNILTDGSQFAVAFVDDIATAYSDAELGKVGQSYTKVIDIPIVEKAIDGSVTKPGWDRAALPGVVSAQAEVIP